MSAFNDPLDEFKRELDRQTERAATEVPKLVDRWVPGDDDGTIFDRLKVTTGKDRIFRVSMRQGVDGKAN